MSMTPAQFWQLEMQNRQQIADKDARMGEAIAGMAQAYSDQKAKDARAGAFEEFLGMHGETMGLQPEWLEEYRKKSRDEKLAIGDMMLNSYLPHQQRMSYLDRQAELYPRTGGGGAAAASQVPVYTFD